MATKEQVEDFLKRLKEKIKVFDIIFVMIGARTYRH